MFHGPGPHDLDDECCDEVGFVIVATIVAIAVIVAMVAACAAQGGF